MLWKMNPPPFLFTIDPLVNLRIHLERKQEMNVGLICTVKPVQRLRVVWREPHSVVFDGHRFVAGSAPHGDSLESDYAGMFADKHDYRSWGLESDFTWTGDNSSGALSWSMGIQPDEPELMTWRHRLMVVEHSAYFPEGSNGLEHYDDIVRAVIELNVTGNNGTAVGGEQEITLPAAYDGDDLALVVVHEWKQTPPTIEPNPNEGPASLPGFLAPLGLVALGAAAVACRD